MNTKTLTTLIIRIAGLYLLIQFFNHFGTYFFSSYSLFRIQELEKITNITPPEETLLTRQLILGITNIIVSITLVLKADWIAKKLVKSPDKINSNFDAKSLSTVILLSAAVLWIMDLIVELPYFIDYTIKTFLKSNQEKVSFNSISYLTKLISSILIITKIDTITNWISRKAKNVT